MIVIITGLIDIHLLSQVRQILTLGQIWDRRTNQTT